MCQHPCRCFRSLRPHCGKPVGLTTSDLSSVTDNRNSSNTGPPWHMRGNATTLLHRHPSRAASHFTNGGLGHQDQPDHRLILTQRRPVPCLGAAVSTSRTDGYDRGATQTSVAEMAAAGTGELSNPAGGTGSGMPRRVSAAQSAAPTGTADMLLGRPGLPAPIVPARRPSRTARCGRPATRTGVSGRPVPDPGRA